MSKTIADRIVDAKNTGEEALFGLTEFTNTEDGLTGDPRGGGDEPAYYKFNPMGLALFTSEVLNNEGFFVALPKDPTPISAANSADLAAVDAKINEILEVLADLGLVSPIA